MKKIATAATVAALSILSAAGMTFAAWTDSVTVTNNVVQTGTTDLRVSNNNGASWDQVTVATSNVVSGLVPGAANKNSGYSWSLWNNSTTGANFGLTAQVTAANIAPDNTVDRSKLYITIYDTTTGLDESAEYTLAQWEAGAQALTTALNSGAWRNYGIRVRLDGTALNQWQGQTAVFTLTFTGTTL